MKLDEVFGQGHAVALARNPLRRAVRLDGQPGYHQVDPKALPALAVRRQAQPSDIQAPLQGAGAEGDWSPDFAHCWCPECIESRRLSQTACD